MGYSIRPYKDGEERYVADLHTRIYTEEYSWGPAFTYYAVKIAMDFAGKEKSEREEMYIAESDGVSVGCIMLCGTDDPDIGQLRLFAVEKDHRRRGVGKALIDALMEKAKSAGYKGLILWTADPLKEAIRIYESFGFKKTETVPNDTWRTDGGTVYEIKMELHGLA